LIGCGQVVQTRFASYFRDNVAIVVDLRDFSGKLQSYPQLASRVECDAMRPATTWERIQLQLLVEADLHQRVVVLPGYPQNGAAVLIKDDFVGEPG
jgi:hypothetical protein